MVQLAKCVRSIFGVEALFALLFIPSLLRMIDLVSAVSGILLIGIALLAAAFSVVTGMAWWTLRKGRPSAHGWAIAAGLCNLPLIPFGTAVGIAGLAAFSQPNVVAKTAISTTAPSTAGDGTNLYAGVIASILQGGFILVALNWWYHWAQNRGLPLADFWISLLQINLAIFVSSLCHELGHVFGGWATKMCLWSLVVGPLHFRRSGAKWTFKFHAAGLIGGGSAGMAPADLENMRSRHVFMIAAGPAASLVTAVPFTALALSASGHAWEPAWEFLAVLATLSWAGVSTLIPSRTKDKYSDGAQLYQLLSNGPWADFHMAFSMVSSSLVTPLRSRDFDAAVLERAAAFMPAGYRGMLLHIYLFMHHTDTGNIVEGLRHFDIAESMYPQAAAELTADLHLEFVYVNAVFKGDAGAARVWWQRMEAKGKVHQNVDYWRARAALLWAEGNIAGAREACRRAEACGRELPDAGAYNRDRDEVARIGAILELAEVPPPLPVPQVA